MAKIYGNVKPEDDYTHPLGSEPNFNESMYFNFFDPEQSIGGFIRLGNRANEGYAERTVTLFHPDGRVFFSFERAPIESNEGFEAGGARFEVREPSQSLRTTFRGELLELREPRDMAEPARAFGSNPKRAVSLDLVHDAVGPMFGRVGNMGEAGNTAEPQFARAHYEQHMRVEGEIAVAGERFAIRGFGLRDHSWGPRSWQAIHSYEWLTLNFGPDLGAMISVVRRDPETVRASGVLVRGDALELVVDARVDADYEPGGLYHRRVRVDFSTHGGDSHSAVGEVRSFIPLRNRRGGRTTHIGEGMTEWRMGGRQGFGLSEFLRQV